MGRRGFAPTPTALRKNLAEDRSRSTEGRWPLAGEKEAMPSTEISLAPPEWAEFDEPAIKVWNRLAPMIHRNGLLTEADIPQFVRYCDMLPRWLDAKKFIDEHGETYEVLNPVFEYEGKSRVIVDYKVKTINLHPKAKLYLEYNRALQRLEQEFGLSPSARTRIQAIEAESEDTLEFFFGSRNSKTKVAVKG